MWLVVLGVAQSDDGWKLLLYRLGDSGAGFLPNDMLVVEKILPDQVRTRLTQAPPQPAKFDFPFCVGASNPMICKFDVSLDACKAFGFRSGDVFRDAREARFVVLGVRKSGKRFSLRGDRQVETDIGAARLRVHAKLLKEDNDVHESNDNDHQHV